MNVNLVLEVPQIWIDIVTRHMDIFSRYACGYWAFGVDRHPDRGWLVYDREAGDGYRPSPEATDEALAAWMTGKPLPKHWYRFDEALAAKAYVEGVKLFGVNLLVYDGSAYDRAIQRALFNGKELYG